MIAAAAVASQHRTSSTTTYRPTPSTTKTKRTSTGTTSATANTPHSAPSAWRINLTKKNVRSLAQPPKFRLEYTVTLVLSHLTPQEICKNGQTCKWWCVCSEDNRLWASLLHLNYPHAPTSSIWGAKSLYKSLKTNIQKVHYGDSFNHRFTFMIDTPNGLETIKNAPLYGSTYHTFHTDHTLRNQKPVKGTKVADTQSIFKDRVQSMAKHLWRDRHQQPTPHRCPVVSVGVTCNYKNNIARRLVLDFILKCGFASVSDVAEARHAALFQEEEDDNEEDDKEDAPHQQRQPNDPGPRLQKAYLGMFVDGCPFILQLLYDQHNNGGEQTGATPSALSDVPFGEQKNLPQWRTDDDEQKYLDLQRAQAATHAHQKAQMSQHTTGIDIWVHLVNTRGGGENHMNDTKANIAKERALDPVKQTIPLILLAADGLDDSSLSSRTERSRESQLEVANEAVKKAYRGIKLPAGVSALAKAAILGGGPGTALLTALAAADRAADDLAAAKQQHLLMSSLFTFQFNALKNDPTINATHVYEVSLNSNQSNLTNALVDIGKIGLIARGKDNNCKEWDNFNAWTTRISDYNEAVRGEPSKTFQKGEDRGVGVGKKSKATASPSVGKISKATASSTRDNRRSCSIQ